MTKWAISTPNGLLQAIKLKSSTNLKKNPKIINAASTIRLTHFFPKPKAYMKPKMEVKTHHI